MKFNYKIGLIILLLTFIVHRSQEPIKLKYTPFGKYKVKGWALYNARMNRNYIIGIDRKGIKRVEGQLSPDGPPYLGKAIYYYNNGKIKAIMIYGEKGYNEYYNKNGTLIKREPNYLMKHL